MTAPELTIRAAFPDQDDPAHHKARIALMRLLHAGENAQYAIDDVETALVYLLDDPAAGIFDAILAEASSRCAVRLRSLAAELEKSATCLKTIRSDWRLFVKEGDSDELRGSNRTGAGPAVAPEEECPF